MTPRPYYTEEESPYYQDLEDRRQMEAPVKQETVPYYPDVTVELTGTDSNAFSIMGKVQKAMRRANVPKEEIDKWREEAMSGDHDHLLQTCFRWVNVE